MFTSARLTRAADCTQVVSHTQALCVYAKGGRLLPCALSRPLSHTACGAAGEHAAQLVPTICPFAQLVGRPPSPLGSLASISSPLRPAPVAAGREAAARRHLASPAASSKGQRAAQKDRARALSSWLPVSVCGSGHSLSGPNQSAEEQHAGRIRRPAIQRPGSRASPPAPSSRGKLCLTPPHHDDDNNSDMVLAINAQRSLGSRTHSLTSTQCTATCASLSMPSGREPPPRSRLRPRDPAHR